MSQITLKTLKFSNMFSYGKDNVISLDKAKISQLTAPNGSGKSSIAMIIQETLFNKNIKGIKKADILNRWSKEKNWNSELTFVADDKDYVVSVLRTGAQTKVTVIEDGKDVSDHKVLDTYKMLSEILGLDFEVFSQLTYQSSTDLLEFLKATDANRKKFLINLFNLEKYIAVGDTIKARSSEVDKELAGLQGELKTIEDFLSIASIPDIKYEKEIPAVDEILQQKIGVLQQELTNYETTCKKIDKNNMYIEERDSITFDAGLSSPAEFEFWEEYQALKENLNIYKRDIMKLENDIANIRVNDICPSCGQTIDTSHLEKVKADLQDQLDTT